MNIEFLEEFVYLADTLSFKHTADHFYVSRSVISRHLSSLEDELGVRLVDRSNRGIALTEAGDVFCREAKTVLRDWETALDRARTTASQARPPVRVGYLRNAARPFLVNFVNRMHEASPQVRLSLVCMEHAELQRALTEHSVDLALAVNVHPAMSRNYRSTKIYDDRFSVVCAKSHPLAQHVQGVTLDDLRGQKLLLPDSYVYAGLSDIVDELIDEQAMLVARSFYRDIDMLYLKIQTEGYLAFSSGMNTAMFGDRVAVLPLRDIATDFSVSAFYQDEFTGEAQSACREALEWCRDELANWEAEFSLEFYGQ